MTSSCFLVRRRNSLSSSYNKRVLPENAARRSALACLRYAQMQKDLGSEETNERMGCGARQGRPRFLPSSFAKKQYQNSAAPVPRPKKLTSVSRPSTRPPAAFTNPHTIRANSSAPCVSLFADAELLLLPLPSTEESSCCCCVAVDGDCGCWEAGRKKAICPAVLRIAPEDRSSAMVAFTPGFLERRLRVSSRASGPFVCVVWEKREGRVVS